MTTAMSITDSAKRIFAETNPKAPVNCEILSEMYRSFLLLVLDLNNFTRKIPDTEFITPKEFARFTGYSDSYARQLCREGYLKARQDGVGRSWMIATSEVHRFIAEALRNHTATPTYYIG